MTQELLSIFLTVFKAVLAVFIVAFVSGVLVRKNIIRQKDIESLSHIAVVILLPCLMFSKIVLYFDPNQFAFWWILPIAAIALISLGFLISFILFKCKYREKKKYIAVSSFMNANYLVLPIGQLVFADQFGEFAALCFLFVLGVSPSLWSLGKHMVTSEVNEKLNIKSLITPPFVASLLAIFLVLTTLNRFFPPLVLTSLSFIGDAAIPIVTLIFGAILGSISLRKLPPIADVIKVVSVKLIILPIIVVIVLFYSKLYIRCPLVADLLVIQASVAPATQLIIQVRKYGGDAQLVGGLMLVNYIVCIFTIPAWLTFWRYIILA